MRAVQRHFHDFIQGVAVATFALLLIVNANPTNAAENPCIGEWVLDQSNSHLSFLTVKKGAVVENSKFASFNGTISESGLATVKIQLDSVDTKIDLRNVRMRFLFFETYKFPEATVTALLHAGLLSDLTSKRRISYPIDFVLDLHGLKKTLTVDTVVTLMSDNKVSVASVTPLPIPISLFEMEENVLKLEDAAKVTIVRTGSVSFNFVFSRGGVAETVMAKVEPKNTAVETKGDLSGEACRGRFEILSRTGAIYFKSGSANVQLSSAPLLRTVADIVSRCPGLNILIAGHTDSDGGDGYNQNLSEARARSVLNYLAGIGIQHTRMNSVGYGESQPVAENNTERNRRLNRRIEFRVSGG